LRVLGTNAVYFFNLIFIPLPIFYYIRILEFLDVFIDIKESKSSLITKPSIICLANS
jgi:hypothetical protein